MTWLDVGNGWRNLFLLSCLLQMAALGGLFGARKWFSSRLASVLGGAALTPLCQYLWMLLMSLVWANAPRMVLIGVPPAVSLVVLCVLALRRVRGLKGYLHRAKAYGKRILHIDRPALISLTAALCMVMLLLPPCVRFCSSMESVVRAGDSGEYMALAQRYCENRSLSDLLEKEETVGHFRGHSHFPSMELYMSYGLLHTSGEVGYPNDKAAFTALGMLTFYVALAYAALLVRFTGGRKRWLFLGILLWNLVPNFYDSIAAAPRDLWRIEGLLVAVLAFAQMKPTGDWKRYVGTLALSFATCFAVMSTHVVCFVVLPFIVVAWVVWRFAESRLTALRGAWRTLAGAIGIALSGAAGTLLAFSGNLWCYFKWGELSPWRLMTTFTDAPWYEGYMQMEYRLEETTTHLNFFEAKDSILQSYSTHIGDVGLWLALFSLIGVIVYALYARRKMRRDAQTLQVEQTPDGPVSVTVLRKSASAGLASDLLLIALITLLTLAPMTGVLDSPLYSFSGSFLKLPRYTLQWFLTANVMTCAALSALEVLLPKLRARVKRLPAACDRAPAWLCAALCAVCFVSGVDQTGYTNTIYRYSRGVMEDEQLLLDNGFRDRYALLRQVAAHVSDEDAILISRVGYQYALRGRGYVITSNPVVELLNIPLTEVEAALRERRVVMLATEPNFWDERYYAQTTLSEYLNALPPEQIVETESMRLYLIDPALVPFAAQD